MKKLFFFFPATEKKKTASRSNEWMANELSWEKKKYRKNTQKCGKKKYNPIFNKKRETLPKIEWMAHELFFGKKCIFFFPASREKKKQDFGFWMNEWAMNFRAEKKKYGTFDGI